MSSKSSSFIHVREKKPIDPWAGKEIMALIHGREKGILMDVLRQVQVLVHLHCKAQFKTKTVQC